MSDTPAEIPADAWIVADCHYSEADVREFVKLALGRARNRMRWFSFVLGGTIFLASIMIAMVREGPPPPGVPVTAVASAWSELLISLWPMLAIAFVLVFIGRRWVRRALSKRSLQKFGPLQRPRTLIFTPRGISMREPLSATEYAWGAFCEWRELRSIFVLYVSESSAEIVPKCFIREPPGGTPGSDAALERFRQILRMCIDAQQLQQPGFPVMGR
jgi:hypothetical protein